MIEVAVQGLNPLLIKNEDIPLVQGSPKKLKLLEEKSIKRSKLYFFCFYVIEILPDISKVNLLDCFNYFVIEQYKGSISIRSWRQK